MPRSPPPRAPWPGILKEGVPVVSESGLVLLAEFQFEDSPRMLVARVLTPASATFGVEPTASVAATPVPPLFAEKTPYWVAALWDEVGKMLEKLEIVPRLS